MTSWNMIIPSLLLSIGVITNTQAQASREGTAVDDKVWKSLAAVTYEISEDEFGELSVPSFGEAAKALEGKTVTVPGYIIPFEGLFKPQHVIISSLPLASCFFCGVGGQETVMEVNLDEPVKYTASLVAFRGTLKLNDTDYEQLMYILEDAEFVGKVE